MRITIIGAGNMGAGYGKLFAQAGHQVTYTYARDPKKLDQAARASGPTARAVALPADAVRDADVVFLTVPYQQVPAALAAVGAAQGALRGKVLAEAVNAITTDMSGLEVGFTTSGAEEIAKLAPGAKVVMAGQNTFAEVVNAPERTVGGETPTLFFCGDDAGAKATVAGLMREAGYAPVDGGPLQNARYLEPLCFFVIQLAYAQGMGPHLGLALLRDAPAAAAAPSMPQPGGASAEPAAAGR